MILFTSVGPRVLSFFVAESKVLVIIQNMDFTEFIQNRKLFSFFFLSREICAFLMINQTEEKRNIFFPLLFRKYHASNQIPLVFFSLLFASFRHKSFSIFSLVGLNFAYSCHHNRTKLMFIHYA